MLTVIKSNASLSSLLGEQEIDGNALYRPLSFCVVRRIDGVAVVFNTLTRQMIELSEAEGRIISQESIKPTGVEELIKNWFLVPLGHNDIAFADEARALLKMFENATEENAYTIMTTTDCNARCYYCYETGVHRVPMTEQTACDVADYIIHKNKGKAVKLYWHGGEPLFNMSAIDTICARLRKAKVEYTSFVYSNGYLFDDSTVIKAVDDWNMKSAQITLDGTEEIYNKSKAYIYKDAASPYYVVMDNIGRLLNAGVFVKVRMNMDLDNVDDLYTLADELCARHGGDKNLFVYPELLFEPQGAKEPSHSPEERMILAKEFLKMQEYCIAKGVLREKKLSSSMMVGRCQADSRSAFLITPDGHLGKCAHFAEQDHVGSIYDENLDVATVDAFCEIENNEKMCHGCTAYPSCIKLKKCPGEGFYACDASKRLITETQLARSVEYTYKKEKAK